MRFVPGAQVGKYRLVAPLGSGGMGGVWEVDDDTGARFALKSPASLMTPSPESMKRFAREANALRVLEHPNLVSAVDVFTDAGFLFLVMERVVGVTLGKAIDAGPLDPRRALVIARQILEGVGHAHANGFVHRDLKPDNIMLVEMGGWERAKILDFGIVKLIGEAEAAMGGNELTTAGFVVGTAAYMSPEQAIGANVDGRADLYAVGTMLFEMLTGRVPFHHPEQMRQMQMQVKAPVPRLDEVMHGASWCSPQLTVLIDGALAKDPASRFPDAQTMIAALDDAFLSLEDNQ